jgi:hypothetical protein
MAPLDRALYQKIYARNISQACRGLKPTGFANRAKSKHPQISVFALTGIF